MDVNQQNHEIHIDWLPLLDCSIILVAALLLMMAIRERGIRINLPSTSDTDAVVTSSEGLLRVRITKEGGIYLGEQRLEINELQRKLGDTDVNKVTCIVVEADALTPHGVVLQVYGVLSRLGKPVVVRAEPMPFKHRNDTELPGRIANAIEPGHPGVE